MTIESIIERLARRLAPGATPLQLDCALEDTWRDLAAAEDKDSYDQGFEDGYRQALRDAKQAIRKAG
jgi:hypothetical protein